MELQNWVGSLCNKSLWFIKVIIRDSTLHASRLQWMREEELILGKAPSSWSLELNCKFTCWWRLNKLICSL
ncbi:hypothetical protein BS78_03G150300 [Paspalum vaginatum]|nr:hypothetical protein BS78_03G150300 [Paspalum vaginatum]